MCDYSLFSIRNRLATEGEELTVYCFQTGSVGLASSSDPATAVCISPGTRLLVQDVPERLQAKLGIGLRAEAIFFERTAEPYEYRDAVRFDNGRDILIQHLAAGQRVIVLSLTAAELRDDRQRPVTYRQAYEESLTA